MEKLLFEAFGPLIVAAVLLLIVIGVRDLAARFRSRLSQEQLSAAREVFQRRLLNPQPADVERELGRKLPERLLQLYEDKTAIQSCGFKVMKPGGSRWRSKRWPVHCFEPLDTESLHALPYEEEFGPGFCFAASGSGCWYWIAASDLRAKDSPVIFFDYDGSGAHGEKVADTLDEFLSWPRVPKK